MSGAANNPYFETSKEPNRDDLLRIMTAPTQEHTTPSTGASIWVRALRQHNMQ